MRFVEAEGTILELADYVYAHTPLKPNRYRATMAEILSREYHAS
jgi:hypothetical protein